MYFSVVVVLNIVKTLIVGEGVLKVINVKDVHDHPVDQIGLDILMGVEGSGFGELGVQ
jgi:hypothetical protein